MKKVKESLGSPDWVEEPSHSTYTGVSESRKKGILDELCPLMPENRRQFWETL